jgi:hypothetical protein
MKLKIHYHEPTNQQQLTVVLVLFVKFVMTAIKKMRITLVSREILTKKTDGAERMMKD